MKLKDEKRKVGFSFAISSMHVNGKQKKNEKNEENYNWNVEKQQLSIQCFFLLLRITVFHQHSDGI